MGGTLAMCKEIAPLNRVNIGSGLINDIFSRLDFMESKIDDQFSWLYDLELLIITPPEIV